jgi:hypothetical protein
VRRRSVDRRRDGGRRPMDLDVDVEFHARIRPVPVQTAD